MKTNEVKIGEKAVCISNMDCFEFLKTIEDSSVDLVLTDPPYGISKKTGFKNVVNGVPRFAVSMDFGEWDKNFTGLDRVLKEFYRVLRDGGTVIVFYDIWKLQSLKKWMEDAGFGQVFFIQWEKTNPVPINSTRNYLTNAREVALRAIKGSNPTFNSKHDNGIYLYPICHGKHRKHPTQKPVELFEELIEEHSNEGDLVLDCFLGAGTTAIAAKHTGRRFKGCDNNKEYYYHALKWAEES